MKRWQRSLKKLLEAIPPPSQPRWVSGPLLDPTLPALPEDHAALIAAYGSGQFSDSKIGCVVEVFNPRDPWHEIGIRESLKILRDYRESEGDEYLPYPVYPETPGILICGWNDKRDYWFWHTKGADSNRWPTVYYGDMEDAFEYKMPLVVFMQKLFFGEISRQDLGFGEPDFEPAGFEFRPSWRQEKTQ